MHKTILIICIFIYSSNLIFTSNIISFAYKGKYYTLRSSEAKEVELLAPFNPFREVDRSQTHRMLLSSLEKSNLTALSYIGEQYEFNQIRLTNLLNNIYRIEDLTTGFTVKFGIGLYDSILLYSFINFENNTTVIINKLATLFLVKQLLIKMTGKVEVNKKETKVMSEDFQLRLNEYNRFLSILKEKKTDTVPEFLTSFIKINVKVNPSGQITGDWTNPIDLYYYKTGDYKSISFFYYYTLKQLGMEVNAYLVTDIIKKNIDEVFDMQSMSLSKKQDLELKYGKINPTNNITKLITDSRKKTIVIPEIFYYHPPDFKRSALVVTVKIGDLWWYSTGLKWINNNLRTKERVCSDYAMGGCYYSRVENDGDLFNNQPLIESDFIWDVFFPM